MKKRDNYVYDITPQKRAEKWKKIDTHKEKIEECQIDNALQDMSTKGLVCACLDYPMIGDMTFFENNQYGFENIKNNFNGLQELLKRANSGSTVFDVYKNLNLEELVNNAEYPLLQLRYLETLLAQTEILESLTLDERKELIYVCEDVLNAKITEYSEKLDPIPSVWIIVRIMNMDDKEFEKLVRNNENLAYFEKYGDIKDVSEEEINQVVEYISMYY